MCWRWESGWVPQVGDHDHSGLEERRQRDARGTHTWSNVVEQRDPTCVLCGPILKAVQFEAFERPATLATLVALGHFSAAGDLTLTGTFHPSSRLFTLRATFSLCENTVFVM